MNQNSLFQKEFLITTVLEKYTRSYLPSFSLEEIDKLDLLSNKNAKYLLYKFNDWIESMGAEKILIRHTSKIRGEIGLHKIEEKDKQFLIEKIIAKIENKNPYEIKAEKEPEIMLEIEKKYRICRRVYQALFYEIAESFIQYINTLIVDEIEQVNADLKSNGWEVKSIVEIEDCIELLKLFQLFYYFNGRLPLTNGLLPISDVETPDGSEKIYLKNL